MKKKLVVIGIAGMLGHTLFKLAEEQSRFDVCGTQRRESHNDHIFFLDLTDSKMY